MINELFTPYEIKGRLLPNRLVLAPAGWNYAEFDGTVSEKILEYYSIRAASGLGLVMVEGTLVDPNGGLPGRRILAAWDDRFIPGLSRLAAVIKSHGGLAGQQLVHMLRTQNRQPADLDLADIDKIKNMFSRAAGRLKQAGFDLVELHMAHSYTMADFLSRRTNKRLDSYGGSLEKRVNLALETIELVRAEVGKDMLISCRLSGDELQFNGNSLKHTLQVAKLLEQSGIDLLSISAGGRVEADGSFGYSYYRAYPMADQPDAVNAYLGKSFKEVMNVPVIIAGKIPNPKLAEDLLQAGCADLIGLARPLLADPFFAAKAREGRLDEINYCIYCRVCREESHQKKPGRCPRWERFVGINNGKL